MMGEEESPLFWKYIDDLDEVNDQPVYLAGFKYPSNYSLIDHIVNEHRKTNYTVVTNSNCQKFHSENVKTLVSC